jgi:hypothetical protein
MSVGALFYRNFQTYFSGLARMGIYFYGSPYGSATFKIWSAEWINFGK